MSSEAQDIRVWARNKGIDIGDRGRIPGSLRDEYEAEQAGGVTVDADGDLQLAGAPEPISLNGDVPGPGPSATPGADRASSPAPGPGPAERPPQAPPGKHRRGLLGDRKPRPPGPRPTHKRVSIENIVSTGYGIGAMFMARSNDLLMPMARVMDMQAPVVGVIAEDKAKGTLLDKALQPLARGGENAELAAALLGPPVFVGLMTAHPEWSPALRPMLKMSLMSYMRYAGPAMDKTRKRQEKLMEDFGDVDLDAIIDGFFAGVPEAGPVSSMEEEHVRRARGDS